MVSTPQPCWPHLDEPVLSGRWHPSVEPTAVLFGMPAVFVSATINARAPYEVTDFQITLNPDRVWHALVGGPGMSGVVWGARPPEWGSACSRS